MTLHCIAFPTLLFRVGTLRSISTTLSCKKKGMAVSVWSYDHQDKWKDIPGCQASGVQQSPINIVDVETKNNSDLKAIQLDASWLEGLSGSWKNTGSSLQFKPQDGSKLSIVTHTGCYHLDQFHFHWGSCLGEGSEHTINSVSKDSELHFVLKHAEAKDDLSVLAVLLKADPVAPITGSWNTLAQPPKYGESRSITKFPVHSLFPPSLNYWYYRGSLTTPPCSEIVNWYVFHEHVMMPAAVLEMWRKMEQDASGKPLTSSFRHTQLLHGRTVSCFST